MHRYIAISAFCVLAFASSTGVALASSDAAYATFNASVSKTCTALAKSRFADPIVFVDAFGSASYGIAQRSRATSRALVGHLNLR